MKRGFLVLAFIILIIPSTFATLVIDGPSKNTYNLGDEVLISGYVSRSEDFEGLFTQEFICDGKSFPLPISSLSLVADERKNFPSDFGLPKIIVSNRLSGTCIIRASLIEGITLETATSDNFEISRELEGTFDIDETRIQLGKSFTLTGDIFKLNGNPVEGSGEVYFQGNGTRFLVDIFQISDGSFNYVYESKAIPQGEYDIGIFVNDIHGNQKMFEKIARFISVKELYVFAKVDENTMDPGSEVRVFGEAKTILQDDVTEGVVTIEIEDQKIITNLDDGNFEHEFRLIESISSGRHILSVTVADNFGNKGINEINIFINQKPTSLVLELTNDSIGPGDTIVIEPILYDQAGDVMRDIVLIDIRDPSNDLIFSDTVSVNEEVLLLIDKFAEPGSYKVRAEVDDLVKETFFVVEPISVLNIILVEQELQVENIGNIEYKKPIRIELNRGVYSITKRESLDPGENFTIMLNQEFPSGQYDLRVIYDDNLKEFKDVIIVGKAAKSLNIPYILLFFIVIVLLVILAMHGRNFKRASKARTDRDRKLARETKKMHKKPKPKKEFFKSNEEDLADFKERVIKEIKETEEKGRDMVESKKGSYYGDNENKDSLFKLFE